MFPVTLAILLLTGPIFAQRVAVCRGNVEPGVRVNVADESGAPITDARVTLTSGKYREIMRLSTHEFPREGGFKAEAGRTYRGAVERPGSYRLEVEKTGYRTATRKVKVIKTGCNVTTVDLTVSLTKP